MGSCASCSKKEKPANTNPFDELQFETSTGEGELKSLGSSRAGSSGGGEGDREPSIAESSKSIVVAYNVSRKFKEEEKVTAFNSSTYSHDELTWVKMIPAPPRPQEFPYYVTVPIEEFHLKLFQEVFKILLDDVNFYTTNEGRRKSPFEFLPPDELRKTIDFSLPNQPVAHTKLLELVKQVIRYQPRFGHPFYMEQRVSGLDPYSVVADLVATVTNANNVLYILSTVTTLIELELIRAVSQLVGFDPDGDGDGAVTPGATLANGYAMRMAVKHKLHHLKHLGLFGSKRPCFFVGESNRYIHHKCAIFQGFGMDSVIPIKEDPDGKMSMENLSVKVFEAFALGHVPCMVVATAGSNVLRTIDPLEKIADFCKAHDLWFHCDATFGGALLLSNNLKGRLRGVERADSFTWSQHFVIGVPPTSSVLAVPPRHKHKLAQYLGLGEGMNYGFMKTPLYDPRYDISHNTILSCRRPEMFKFWFAWKAKGTKLLGKHVDHLFENARFCLDKIKNKAGFVPILEEFEGTNVCFYYVPQKFRDLEPTSAEFREKISLLTVAIRRVLVQRGKVSLNYYDCPYTTNPTFFVLGLHNSAVTPRDILYVLDKIQEFAEVLANKSQAHHTYHDLILMRANK